MFMASAHALASLTTELLKADELTTDFPLCQFYYALTRVYSGETAKAISAYELLIQKDSGIFGEISKMWKAALTKNMADFENLAAMLREYALRDKELSWWLADCSASMEKTEDALYWLNNSIEQGLINDIFFSKFDPVLSRYRDDSRFIALMNKARGKQERFKEILGLNIFN